jgi:hypothetical protein
MNDEEDHEIELVAGDSTPHYKFPEEDDNS